MLSTYRRLEISVYGGHCIRKYLLFWKQVTQLNSCSSLWHMHKLLLPLCNKHICKSIFFWHFQKQYSELKEPNDTWDFWVHKASLSPALCCLWVREPCHPDKPCSQILITFSFFYYYYYYLDLWHRQKHCLQNRNSAVCLFLCALPLDIKSLCVVSVPQLSPIMVRVVLWFLHV